MTNKEVARILNDIGDILQVTGESTFRIGAYHKAARVIETMADDINEVAKSGPDDLKNIPGIGAHLSDRIYQLVTTGKMDYYEEVKKTVDPGVIALMHIPGMGPKKAKLVNDLFGISTIDQLEEAAKNHKLKDVKGLGAKTEDNILKSIEEYRAHHERILLSDAYPLAKEIVAELKRQPFVEKADFAGSLRRLKSTIGDIDILVASKEPDKASTYFTTMKSVSRVLAKGKTKSAIVHESGLEVDLRVVDPDEYGAALMYFTGSKEESIALRGIAKKRGLKINEYGIFRTKDNKRLASKTEDDMYAALGLPYIIPQLRENKGEVEAAYENRLPKVIKIKDIKGDLHAHTKKSDGSNSIEEMVVKAIELNYQYIAITDHAENLKFVGGLTPEELDKQARTIAKLNKKYDEITILTGSEVNIDNDGKIDYEEEVLKKLNVVSASIHSGFGQSREQLTERAVKAIENPYVNVFSHPTGVILNKREPYQIDMDKVFEAAVRTGTALELNSYPNRLDLNEDYLKKAKEMGVKIAINTDAHNKDHLNYIFYGVATAQRGWLEKKDVINTWNLKKLLEFLKK
jgi:DNA polymerase (family 10)